jgi:hypothetical protein
MHRTVGRWLVAIAGATAIASPAWAARDMCQILKDKGILDDVEFNECKAAQEKEEVQAETKTAETVKSNLPSWLDKVKPIGDIRFRGEGFYEDGLIANNRFRIRARVGLAVKASDELEGAVRIATGNPNDPISTNQTLGNTFDPKDINLNWAYMTVTPGKTFGIKPNVFSITGGKFATPNFKVSELVWDDDLSPEGAWQSIVAYDAKDGFFRKVKLYAFEWTVDQISAASDPWMFGGQAVADMAIGSTANWALAFADYSYQDMNSVANKYLNSASSSYNSSLANSNSVLLNDKGNVYAYKYGFNMINPSTEVNFPNPFGIGLPAGLYGELVYNTEADTRNTGFILGAGIGDAKKGYYGDSLKERGDWGASYTYEWVEKDSTLSIFAYSDLAYVQSRATQSGATNVTAHILRLDYVLLNNLQLTAKAHFINALDLQDSVAYNPSNPAKSLRGNPTLTRIQLDAVYKF